MIKGYLITFLRHLKQHWGLALLNISSYGLGIGACLLLMQHILYETSFDTFYDDHEKIHRVALDHFIGGVFQHSSANSFYDLGPELKKRYPEIAAYTKLKRRDAEDIVTVDGKSFLQGNWILSDTNYFKVFSHELVYGSTNDIKVFDAFITSETSARYFGETNPVGKTFKQGWNTLTIRGVLKSMPNSHLKFDILYVTSKRPHYVNNWTDCLVHTYIKLNSKAESFNDKLNDFSNEFSQLSAQQSQLDYAFEGRLQPLASIHLESDLESELEANGNFQHIYILLALVGMILLISCFNYVSLTNAINTSRSKETFVRKVHGALFKHLLVQYVIESLVLNILGLVSAAVFIVMYVEWLNPVFNFHNITFAWTDPRLYGTALVIFVISMVLFGILPAGFKSGRTFLHALEIEQVASINEGLTRNVAILQFFIAYTLVSGALAVSNQIRHLNAGEPGFDQTGVLALNIKLIPFPGHEDILGRLANDLENETAIKSVSFSYAIPGDVRLLDTSVELVGAASETASNSSFQTVSPDYFDTYGIELLKGRTFSDERGTDSLSVLINESLAGELGLSGSQDAIGERIIMDYFGKRVRFTVIGLVKDYYHQSIKEVIQPMLYIPVRYYGAVTKISVKVNGHGEESFKTAEHLLQSLFEENLAGLYKDSGLGMAYDILDVSRVYQSQYRSDQQFSTLVGSMALLALFMTGIGFFGLASKTTNRRTKEIAIRKINGASISNLVSLLIAYFMRIAGWAFVLSLPFSYFVVQSWLNSFPVRISIGLWFIMWPLAISVSLVLLSIGHSTLKVAKLNPISILRSE